MGTSNAYGGAGGGTPLIPSWLQGDDDAALRADAAALMAALPKPAAPNINAASGGTNGAQLVGGMTEEQLREQATRLGVNPEYYRKQFLRS